MKTTKAIIGSVSHGTMRSEDLIPCFMGVLDELKEQWAISPNGQESEYKKEFSRIDDNLSKIEQARSMAEEIGEDYYTSDGADNALEFLFDELEKYAPPYFYFGAHPGDGSDYGFWLSKEFQQDFKDNGGLEVSDTSEVPADYSGEVLHVNDHGNCTLYSADNGKLTEVWAVV